MAMTSVKTSFFKNVTSKNTVPNTSTGDTPCIYSIGIHLRCIRYAGLGVERACVQCNTRSLRLSYPILFSFSLSFSLICLISHTLSLPLFPPSITLAPMRLTDGVIIIIIITISSRGRNRYYISTYAVQAKNEDEHRYTYIIYLCAVVS